MTQPEDLFSLTGKTALVTGGTSGIGAMIAKGLLRQGVRTYITGRDRERTEQAARKLQAKSGGECIGLAADFAHADGPAALARKVADREGALHILVNNAGTSCDGALSELSVDAWDEVMAVNLRAPVFLIRALLPLMKAAASNEDPARIINLGSIGGLHVPGWEAHPYGASKAAIHHVTRSLAKSLGGDRITVNAIAPGPFPSKMHDADSEATRKAIASFIPLDRAGQAEDAQGAVIFLASRAGAYVNGHILPLEGGYIGAL
ncbi:SDR family oxidoreductase [Aurantiacibacter poecillastricola]|uniref:SDR family oxidoreductase n=1 Tax=Aurantiacibacter poecillastricola TaxID=3064385 RepID=UPI00273DF366|nr:SDR family oxidoreductase [Aurantiacibacter sp. 219JJ12-13]MDP5263255.1 SDR family oxidoreductase [Aurantiacibacter sp. 219JJ12-13]